MIRRHWFPLSLAATALVLLAGGLVLGLRGSSAQTVGALVAGALGLAGAAVIRGLHGEIEGEPDAQPRHVSGPDLRRRVLLGRLGVGGAAAAAAVLAIPTARRVERATAALAETPWRDGTRVVDDRGELVRAVDVPVGELLTVWPEGHVGVNDAQAVLLREEPNRIVAVSGREGWTPAGFVAYSKLCTHMACPVGLYQQQAGTLLCPCHQALFDALDGGAVVRGPARRPLPQLPLAIDDDDVLVARGDFSDAVGTGFWYRP